MTALLTEWDIVQRAERRRQRSQFYRIVAVRILALLVIVLCALWLPVHSWLHSHLQFIFGVLVGSVLELTVVFLWDRATWIRWFSWQ